jgi:hypothetical protein
MKQSLSLFLVTVLLLSGGCATIPKEAPILSSQLGEKINTIQTSHFNLLDQFFENKREKVDEFLVNEWIPLFAKNFFNDPVIDKVWDEIVSSGNKEDRLKLFVLLGPKLQTQINQKRLELIKPLDDLETELENRIRYEYEIARSINNTLTSFLYSASKVEENRIRYLEKVGISDESIGNVITKTDEIVSKLGSVGDSISEKEEQVKLYIDKLKGLKEQISNNLKNQ